MKNRKEQTGFIDCQNSYYIPNTNIRVDEYNPQDLDKLWDQLNAAYSIL